MLTRALTALIICALGAGVYAAAAQDAQGAGWHSCRAQTFTTHSGLKVRVGSLKAEGLSCSRARSVLREFYSLPIGSSGANVALGYGCHYTRSGAVCEQGTRRISWRDRIVASSSSRRSCGTVSVTLSEGDTRYARRITTRNVTCSKARRLARNVTGDPGEGGTYQGFRCGGAGNGTGGKAIICRRGSTWVRWRY